MSSDESPKARVQGAFLVRALDPGFEPLPTHAVPAPDLPVVAIGTADRRLRFDSPTCLRFHVPTMVSFISRVMMLLPGDLVYTARPADIKGFAVRIAEESFTGMKGKWSIPIICPLG